ncbi:hypothetical protein N7478_000682 [Penicillium angulare]|uniref:uncharacterized protein n=1 Tax=Penicillium angulare TaxID=116970 RepID=UPI0025407613|nr:uncharacterized protein N7478_000682 [Penicillium angulare]KAJ5291431.1 hypothetical protein N7478_000682 [Penicillium angulare]
MRREFEYEGDDASYIRFLEAKVRELQSKLERGRPSNQRTRTRRNLDVFLGNIPYPSDWARLGHDSPENSTRILKALIGRGIHLRGGSVVPGDPDMKNLLRQYTHLTIQTNVEDEFLQCLAHFRELVLVSLFAVNLGVVNLGVVNPDDTHTIYDIMRVYMESQQKTKKTKATHNKKTPMTEKTLRKRIQGALWANRMIFALSQSPWGSKCSLCFFVAGQPVSYYARYAEFSDTRSYLLHHMREKANDEPDQHPESNDEPDQESDDESDQESDDESDQESDDESDQEPDSQPDQEIVDEPDQETVDGIDQTPGLTPLAIPLIIKELMGGSVS